MIVATVATTTRNPTKHVNEARLDDDLAYRFGCLAESWTSVPTISKRFTPRRPIRRRAFRNPGRRLRQALCCHV
jgi:hypothetical protein